jgi:uncharacterized protein (DUF2062 family)
VKKNILAPLKTAVIRLFKINDSPQKIALGVGLGVFLGIFPGTGPMAALFVALLLPVNRASVILGVLATNTWLSIATFLLSIKVGSVIMHLNWQDVLSDWSRFLHEFQPGDLFKVSVLKIILPVLLGFTILAFSFGLVAYLATLIVFTRIKREALKKERII